VAKIVAIVTDLMLASRVSESLRAAGHEVSVVPALPDPLEAEAIVCDLDTADTAAVAAAAVPTLGFYSHVDIETKQQAEAAGLKLIVPRSRMSRELPDLVADLLNPSKG
jgi:nucleoside-diphosphate-sugar epimerase